jgi:hypothetical protein
MPSPLEERFAKAVYLIRHGPKKNSSNDEKLKVYNTPLVHAGGSSVLLPDGMYFSSGENRNRPHDLVVCFA